MKLRLTPKKSFYLLLGIIALLLVANLMAIGLRHSPEGIFPRLLTSGMQLFDFNSENSFPTLFSCLLLLVSAVLLFLISLHAKEKSSFYRYWLFLSFVFVYLSLDEALMFHEALMLYIREYFQTTGFFYYAWIIPYGGFLVVLGIVYLPFLKHLPLEIARYICVAAIIYVSGAIGFEAVSGKLVSLYEEENLWFKLIYTVEELFEMVGIAVFIFGLLVHLQQQTGSITFMFKEQE